MNEAKTPTWNLLPSLGFQPDGSVYSDIRPGFSLDFGNLKLSAAAVTSPYSGEIILFGGVFATPRTIAQVQFELPRRMESLEQCAAWIVWNLDQYGEGPVFRPSRNLAWLEQARQNRRLLPWVMSHAEFDSRPQCTVGRDWLRLALKELHEQLALLTDDVTVVFSFDGAIFSIRCNTKVIAFPGEGPPWTVCFKVKSETLRQRPKRRLTREYVGVSIWKSRIELGPWSYEGAIGSVDGSRGSEVQ